MIKKKIIKKAALYATVLIVSLTLISPFLLKHLLDSALVKQRAAGFIHKKTGVTIDPEKIDFQIFPQPGVYFKEIHIFLNPLVQLDIQALHINLDIPKLLRGKIAVSQVFVETPKIKYLPLKTDPGQEARIFQLQFPEQEINTLFALFPDSQETLELFINNAQSEYFTSMEGSFHVSSTQKTLTLKAVIQGIKFQKTQFPENSFMENMEVHSIESPKISLNLDLDGTGKLSGNLEIMSPQVALGRIPDTPLAGDILDLEFEFSQDLLSVHLKPFALDYPQARVGLLFSHDMAGDQANLRFSGGKIDISQARNFGLKQFPASPLVKNLFDILREGNANDLLLEFASNSPATLLNGNNLSLTGVAANTGLKIPETPLMAHNVQGNVTLKKGILHVEALQGRIQDTAIKQGTLEIDLMNHDDIPFTGEFTLDLDLSDLPQKLISLLPGTVLARELAKVSQVSGRADALLKLEMANHTLGVQVQTQNFSAQGIYDPIPWPLTITQGKFSYEQDQALLENFSGSLSSSSFSNLSMTIDLSHSPVIQIPSGSARLDLEELMPWLGSFPGFMARISPVKTLTGELGIDSLILKGPILNPQDMAFDILGQAKNVDIGIARENPEIQAVSAGFHLRNQEIQLNGLKARLEDLSWLSPGIDPAHVKSIKIPLELTDARIEKTEDKALFQGQLTFPSGTGLAVDLTGTKLTDLYPKSLILTDIDRSDAQMEFSQDISKPFLEFKGKLNTQTLEHLFIKDSFLHRLVLSHMGENPIKIHTDMAGTFFLEAEKINLDPFLLDSFMEKREKKNSRPLIAWKNLQLNLQELSYKQWDFLDIDALVNLSQNKTYVQIRKGGLCDLEATGQIIVQEGQIKTDILAQAVDKTDIGNLISCLFQKENLIQGPYTFTGKLSGQALFPGLPGLPGILSHQNGVFTLNAGKGRIYKFTLLSRLLSVMNIFQLPDITQKGFGYKSLIVEADVRDSVIYLTKAVIDGDDMALIFTGTIDPLMDKLDLTCLVAPFKTIDTIIKHIPVVNTILMGRLVSFPAKATGSLTNPVVTPLHPSAVGQGLVNMLEDIIKAPGRLLKETP